MAQTSPQSAKKNAPPPAPPVDPKKKKKRLYWIGGGTFFFLIVLMALMPLQGSVQYGICKVYNELNEPYPDQLVYVSVEDGNPVRIYYKKVDPFGVESVNTIECSFKPDAAGAPTTQLTKVDINGKARIYEAESPAAIKRFNSGIPAILDNMPDLTLPNFSLDDIKAYKDIR